MLSSTQLVVGNVYTREHLRDLFGITDATVYTGIFQPKGHKSVWLFVTENKPKDRTQYQDQLVGDLLYWESQATGRKDHLIIEHEERGLEILLFYRKEKYEHEGAAFRYEGPFRYVSHQETTPRRFVLARLPSTPVQVPAEVEIAAALDVASFQDEHTPALEGGKKQRFTDYYERNPKLRAQAIAIHGTVCKVCGFDFQAMYGEWGKNYIEVHHLKPISTLIDPSLVDPKTDMTVLCANCHRMVHRRQNEVLDIEQLRELIANRQVLIVTKQL